MLVAVFAFVSAVLASPLALEERGCVLSRCTGPKPLPPHLDPFHVPPPEWELTAPGTILRSRKIDFKYVFAPQAEAWQLLYRTNGAMPNQSLTTVTTIIKPKNADPNKLVIYNTAEDSCNSTCAPSYAFQQRTWPHSFIVQGEMAYISSLLKMGYYVASADYEGPDSAFGVGQLEGRLVLDGVRAVKRFAQEVGLNADARIAMYGYSGGAVAAGFGAALQPTYAPDVEFAGVAIGGLPANLSNAFSRLDAGLFAGFGFSGVQGLASAYPKIADLVSRVLTPDGKKALEYVKSTCAFHVLAGFAFRRVGDSKFSSLGEGLLRNPEVQAITDLNSLVYLTDNIPSAPMYVFHAKHDTIIPIADVDNLVTMWCDDGMDSLEFSTDIGPTEHVSELIVGFPYAAKWMHDRLENNNATLAHGCKRTNNVFSFGRTDILGQAAKSALESAQEHLETTIGYDDGILKESIRNNYQRRM